LRPLLLCLASLFLAGCAADPFEPSRGLRNQVDASFVRVVDDSNEGHGVAVVVRATYDRVLLVFNDPEPNKSGKLFLAFDEERVATQIRRVGGLTVLESSRLERDLRAVHGAKRPVAGEFVFVYAQDGDELKSGVSSVLRSNAEFLELLVSWGEGSDVEALLESARSGIVMGPQGALVGFLSARTGDARPRVIPFERVQAELLAAGGIPGAEHMWPGDGFLTHRFWVLPPDDPNGVPPVTDEWGDPDYTLVLEQDEREVARTPIHVSPRADSPPELVWIAARHDLRARLVERDVSLTQGDVDHDLTHPLQFNVTRGPRRSEFNVLPTITKDFGGERTAHLDLNLAPVDPERSSGSDRAPLGATRHSLGRVAHGEVDWVRGDATDFWSVDVEQGGSILCFLFRERPGAELRLDAFAPGVVEPVLSQPHTPGRRLTVTKGVVSGGRLLLRIRQVGGDAGSAGYSLFLFPANEKPDALVRVLLRLVGRQGRSARAFMASKAFAQEVKLAVDDEAGLDEAELTEAFLAGIGDRTAEARTLVIHLLHSHFRPTLLALEQVRRSGATQASRTTERVSAAERTRDAALLLARRCGSAPAFEAYLHVLAELEELPAGVLERDSQTFDRAVRGRLGDTATRSLKQAIMDTARDSSDPTTRMTALAAASRWRNSTARTELENELRALLAKDPSPQVRRALERAFPPETVRRRRRIRQHATQSQAQ
jgi:hypothetical protein